MFVVMMTIIIFSVPGMMFLWSTIEARSGKTEKIRWKIPVILLLLLTVCSVIVNIHLLRSYSFPFFQTSVESIIGMGIILFISAIIILINIIITKTIGKNLSESVHDPKLAKFLAAAFAIYFFIVLFIAAPTGKKVAFAMAINEAMEVTSNAITEDFPIVLVTSERECLRKRVRCLDTDFSNQYFIKNNTGKTQEVQVKIQALNSLNEEMKVIDSKIMTLNPDEMRLLETDETNEDASIWNQYSFQTYDRVTSYHHMLRHRDPE